MQVDWVVLSQFMGFQHFKLSLVPSVLYKNNFPCVLLKNRLHEEANV